jgi:iron complex outermembrane recepter protein
MKKTHPTTCLAFWLGLIAMPAAAQTEGHATASGSPPPQSGTLEGRIMNKDTEVYLQGARIEILNTDYRAVSEAEGRFRFLQLPPGSYSITVSYPGLDPTTASVEIPAGRRIHLDFALSSTVYRMEQFIVAGEREGGAFALAMQREALNVQNVLSADTFGTLPNQNVATFLQRMAGISTIGSEGNPITIRVRGIDPSLNSVTMDGTRLPSGGPKSDGDRGVELDKIPGDFIEAVEVTRAPTPDIDADSIGGRVNLKTKSPFTYGRQVTRYTVGTSYNETRGGGARPYGSVFFSSLLGQSQKFGVLLTANYNDYWMERGLVQQTHTQAVPRNRSFINRFRHDTVEQIRASAGARLFYRPSEASTFDVQVLLADYRDTYAAYQNAFNLGTTNAAIISEDEKVLDTTNSTFTQTLNDRLTQVKNSLLRVGGQHVWDTWRLSYNASYGSSRGIEDRVDTNRTVAGIRFRTDRRNNNRFPEFTQLAGPEITDMNSTTGFSATLADRQSDDEIIGSKVDVTRYLRLMEMPAQLKAGVSYRLQHKDRHRQPRTYALSMPVQAIRDHLALFDRGSRYSVDGVYPAMPFIDLPTFRSEFERHRPLYTENPTTTLRNSLVSNYDAEEEITAAYAMGGVTAGKLSLLGGMRAERTSLEGTGFREDLAKPVPERFGTITRKSSYSNLFPSAHVRYELFRGLLVRGGLTTSIGRPSFTSVVGSLNINEDALRLTANNPDLLPQRARNMDLSVEYYYEPAGVLSVGVFTKHITGFIYSHQAVLETGNAFGAQFENWELRTSKNGGKGTVEGFEVNFQQQLSFLKGFLGGFGVFANYTGMSTEGYFELENEKTTLPGFVPRIFNAGIFYDRGRITGKLLRNYQSTHMVTFNAAPFNRIYEYERHQYDLQAGYAFSKKLSLQLSVTNLTNTDEGRVQGDRTRWNRYQTMGRVVSLGVRGQF